MASSAQPPQVNGSALPKVLVASTAMLSFISFWRAAAIVLNDLAASAFYVGGISEQAIGKAAPWFILAVMLFAFAVCQVYIESCSMFVRGGVYRVVKEAMGGTLAKFSVSALMFDYVLTGPIAGVSAGQYLVGFLNDLLGYAHIPRVLPVNSTAAFVAVLITLYFWWQNIQGIQESSDKALRIMQITTFMVVLMIAWCGYTLWVKPAPLPPWPQPGNLRFTPEAEGWLRASRLPETIGVIGILVAIGHSILAMSGLETLAQVYREMASPKLPNLKKTAWIIFIYSLVFTSLVSFFAVMIIPDSIRANFKDNLISGLAMSVVGPYDLRLVFQAFVVLVGILMLSGQLNTGIVGSNGVLNRVSEDGILPAWFRHPHRRFGTSHRIINLIVGLQLITIVLSRGDVILLGEAYAFGVIWSFAMKGLAVLILRYTEPGPRQYRVPGNLRLAGMEVPVGLGLITLTLFAIAAVNLFTKQIATVSGVSFTLIFFAIFAISEKLTHRRAAGNPELDEFHVVSGEEITPKSLGVRPRNILVLARDYNTLYNLESVLHRVNPAKQDVVLLHVHLLNRSASGEHGLEPEQLFATTEQLLFSNALKLAEKNGKTIKLCQVAANDVWDGILRSAQSLQSATLVLGLSAKMPAEEEARLAGLAWERLQPPRPQLTLEIHSPGGQEWIKYLGPHEPRLTPNELNLLHSLWLRFSEEVKPENLRHHDIVHFALNEVLKEIDEGKEPEMAQRLKDHLREIKARRVPHL